MKEKKRARPSSIGEHPGDGIKPSKDWLEDLFRSHHRIEKLDPDPLVFARRFENPGDGELAGVIAAAFAYGQVSKIMEALAQIFKVLGNSPARFLANQKTSEIREAFESFVYRFHKGDDVVLLFHLLQQVLEEWGSLAHLFESVDPGGEIGDALAVFGDRILGGDPRPILSSRQIPERHPVRFLIASPGKGGAAKRLCLFLRWMVRKDEIDPGYWAGRVDPARLVIPLDTHVARVGRSLGFTRRQAADWKTALDITDALRSYDAADPVRYDFTLFRFGMTKMAP